ncbi:hypothetical protein ACTS9C_15530 [Empedobacter brevis]
MELTYDENKFVEYFINHIYIPELLYDIDIEKLINKRLKDYSLTYIEKRTNQLIFDIELTENGYLLKKNFDNIILVNDLVKTIKLLISEFTKEFTLDTIRQILIDYNIHQFIEIKNRIYRNSPFEIDDLFNFLQRPVVYHKKFTQDLSNIIIVYSYSFIKERLINNIDIKNIMDNFQSENDFRLFPYHHYNHKTLKEDNKDYKENKYPEVFTDDKSFNLFLNIIEEFGSNKNDLANYSYIFHYLKKNNYIISNCLHKNFISILKDNNIIISRIKLEKDIGSKLDKKRQIEKIISNFK